MKILSKLKKKKILRWEVFSKIFRFSKKFRKTFSKIGENCSIGFAKILNNI